VHVIIVGCGRVGSELANMLSRRGHNVVIIDTDPDAFRRLGSTFNGVTLRGFGYDEELLLEAGIEKCDALAAVTNSDSANMMVAEIASRIYHIERVVVRLYLPELEQSMQLLGLDFVCDTSLSVAAIFEKMTTSISHSLIVRGDSEVIEFIAGPLMHDKTILDIQVPSKFRICLVTRDGSSFIPWRQTILKENDIILAVVKTTSYSKIRPFVRGS
jgi:trk system potassium uptake protein TrkA